jgi:dUTP pyrophosphatase
MDLFACIDDSIELNPSDPPKLISSGFSINMGEHELFGLVVPRSGLAHHRGLVLGNTIGVIDADYTGPCMISLWNRNSSNAGESGRPILIQPGDRIAQLLFLGVARPEIELVDEFSAETERSIDGFGSTGIKP